MVSTPYYILLLVSIHKCSLLQINRSTIDTIQTTESPCRNFSATYSPTSGMCVCDGTATTFMSTNNSLAGCMKPTDFNCSGVGLVNLNSTVAELKILPKVKSNCFGIQRIFTWNLRDNGSGAWIETSSVDSVFRTHGSAMTNLEGHIFMFECDEICTIVKFEGSAEYPIISFQLDETQNPTNTTNTTKELTVVELVIVIGVPSLVVVILLSIGCFYRHKLPCHRQVWTKRDSTCSKAKMTIGFDNDIVNSDPWSPWYDINKLVEMRRDYLRKPSGDSFYIPTLKGFTKERSSKERSCGGREENVYEMNMAYDSTSRPASRFSCVLAENPYRESSN